MTRIHPLMIALLLIVQIGFQATQGSAAQVISVPANRVDDEPTYQGRTLSYWIRAIRERDEEKISTAFQAIRNIGPHAWPAVPALTELVAAPFVAIQLGRDSDLVIADKLDDIQMRSEAIDALAAIGEAAAPSTKPVIQWALTVRVLPEGEAGRNQEERFIELVKLDAQYRLQVMSAIAAFGKPAIPALMKMLASPDGEKRKLAALTLGEDALDIAAHLLMSRDCADGQQALAIFTDLEPFVPKAYIAQLKLMIVCDAN